jgi:hypothetical protein
MGVNKNNTQMGAFVTVPKRSRHRHCSSEVDLAHGLQVRDEPGDDGGGTPAVLDESQPRIFDGGHLGNLLVVEPRHLVEDFGVRAFVVDPLTLHTGVGHVLGQAGQDTAELGAPSLRQPHDGLGGVGGKSRLHQALELVVLLDELFVRFHDFSLVSRNVKHIYYTIFCKKKEYINA